MLTTDTAGPGVIWLFLCKNMPLSIRCPRGPNIRVWM